MSGVCTSCFVNHGVRETALRIAVKQENVRCGTCGKQGRSLSQRQLSFLLERFFVDGSVPPEMGGLASIYHCSSDLYPSEIRFLTELDKDLDLLQDKLKVGLEHHGPALWKTGHTDFDDLLSENEGCDVDRDSIWNDVIARIRVSTLPVGLNIFRVRTRSKLPPAIPKEFDTPPEKYAQVGRFNSGDFPLFYGSLDVETCLYETKVTLADNIALAKLTVKKPLKVLDLTNVDDSNASHQSESVGIWLEKLFSRSDYELCQELAFEIRKRGFDGFITSSYYAQAHVEKLKNVNLFGYPVVEGKIELTSTNRLKLESIKYEYSYGPVNDFYVNDDLLEKTNNLIESVKNNPNQEQALREFYDEMKKLNSRKSETPI